MSAIGDLLTEARKTTNPTVTTVATARAIAGTSLACADLTGWPTNTAVHFITYKKTATGAIDKTTQCDWKGLVSSNTIGTLTLKSGTDAGNAVGDFVEMGPTAAYGQDLAAWGEVEHSTLGVHALTSNSTITSSKVITGLNDTNGKQIIGVSPTASAVNEVTVANSATGSGPTISATGTDTNIDLNLTPKGTGRIILGGAGAPVTATISTVGLTSSTSYTDIGATGPSVTAVIGTSGLALISLSMNSSVNSASPNNVNMGFFAFGANTITPSDTMAVEAGSAFANVGTKASYVTLLTGLNPGSTTFQAKYRTITGTASISDRDITVVPL